MESRLMKVSLVTLRGKPISVGVGRHCFSIENEQVVPNEAQCIGSKVAGTLERYNDAHELAVFAWTHKIFDETERH